MKQGVIYVRVSDTTQVNGTSLDSQERACVEYAARNNIEVMRVFIEKGESATAANRTEFLKALDFCRERKGEIHAFIVWKIDRFARNTDDHFAVRAKLKQFGTNLFSVTEPITQDPMGKLMETFLAGYAEFENEVRKQRCTGGMQGRLREGIWCWQPPIGYIHSKQIRDRRKTMPDIPDEERFHLIQRGLRLYKTGTCSLEQLAKISTGWGLRTRTGDAMRKQLWETILKDKFYAGILVDPWSGEDHPGRHKPMISMEEYSEIQRIKFKRSGNTRGKRRTFNPDFPLRQFVLCECGHPYTASWTGGRNRRYACYHCHNKECKHAGRSVPKDLMETKFYELLQQIKPTSEYLDFLKQVVNGYTQKRHVIDETEKRRRRSERTRLEKQQRELMSMRINNEISSDEYRELKETLNQQINRLNVADNVTVDNLSESVVASALTLAGNVADEWRAMTAPYKQRFQRLVLTKNAMYHRPTAAFGTAKVSPIFRLNGTFLTGASDFVAEVGRNWSQIAMEIQDIYELAKDWFGEKSKIVPTA